MPNVKRLKQAAVERWPENHTATEQALRTWYPKDHPLHYDLHHPLGKLVGEWGELLDDYMKWRYKPGYGRLAGLPFEPLGELVDVWYYSRILPYQVEINLELIRSFEALTIDDVDYLIATAIQKINHNFIALILGDLDMQKLKGALHYNYAVLNRVCELSDLTIDQLTEASWEKLRPGSERGEEWMKAREFSEQKQLNEALNEYLETEND